MFGALCVLVLARAPVAFRRPMARPAWFASVLGVLGLLSIGVVIPIPVADSWLGGTNILHLLRTGLPVAAFWFLRDAVALQVGRQPRRGGILILCAMLVAQVVVFFQIPSLGRSDIGFVDKHMIYVEGFVWAVVYAAQVVGIALAVVVLLWPMRRGIYATFIIGGLATACGGVALVVHCGQILAGVEFPGAGGIAWVLFLTLFYPGILTMVLGFVAITLRDLFRVSGWKLSRYRLARALAGYEGRGATSVSSVEMKSLEDNPVLGAYRAAIQLRDLESLEGVSLNQRDTRLLAAVERRIAASHLSMAPGQ